MTAKSKHIIWGVGVNLCRFILAIVFIFSGFVKAIDPQGTALKIKDYAVSFGFSETTYGFYFFLLALLLAATEFVLGTSLLLGIRRKITSSVVLLFMVVMTPLTLYLAIANPVSDCGCFGDAWKLTNWETFWKNVVLLAASFIVFGHKMRVIPFVKYGFQWMAPLYSLIYILIFSIYCDTHLPVIDFRPYKIGTDLRQAIYEPGPEDELLDFALYDSENLDDITDLVLTDSNYTFLLIAPRIEEADQSDIDLVNELYEYSLEYGYAFYGVTSSSQDLIAQWREHTGADYPFLAADNIVLLTMIRSNPGVLLMKNGVVLNKWHHSQLPDEYDLKDPLENLPELTSPHRLSAAQVTLNSLLWYILPLILIFLIDILLLRPLEKIRIRYHNKNNKKIIINPLITSKMRKNIVAGNWKMNKTLQEGVALAKELNEALANDTPNCEVVICTPYIHLASVTPIVDAAKIGVGAENCADKESGAYTGEISASMVASTGAGYVILGHSERRAYYGETAEILKEKVKLALANGLTPIFCIGEVLEEREANQQNEIVYNQLKDSLYELSAEDFSKIVLAYEPVWAIGTGKTATSDQAQEIHAYIRSTIVEKYGNEVAQNTSILYGGSCNPSNAKELFSNPDVDGGLIGGASLKVADFKAIIDAFNA